GGLGRSGKSHCLQISGKTFDGVPSCCASARNHTRAKSYDNGARPCRARTGVAHSEPESTRPVKLTWEHSLSRRSLTLRRRLYPTDSGVSLELQEDHSSPGRSYRCDRGAHIDVGASR